MAEEYFLTIHKASLGIGRGGVATAIKTAETRLFQRVRKVLNAGLINIINEVKTSRATGGTTPTRLAVRSGRLRASLNQRLRGTSLDTLVGEVGSWHPAAKVHEYGTVGAGGLLPDIRPRRAKALAIPLDAAKTAAGVARGGPRDIASMYSMTFVRKGIIFGVVSGNTPGVKAKDVNRIVPLFVLKKKVAIPPRLGMRATVARHIPDLLARIREAAVTILQE